MLPTNLFDYLFAYSEGTESMRQREQRRRGVLLGRHGIETAGASTRQPREDHQRNTPQNAPDTERAGKQVPQ